jgi:putative transposase
MTWRKGSAMDERYRFVLEAESYPGSFTELCAQYGISTQNGYKWRHRYEKHGADGLKDQSRAPKNHPNEVSLEVLQEVLVARRAHATWGPKKLRILLSKADPNRSLPALSTIGDILKRNGLSVSRKLRRRATPSTQPFAECKDANRVWCADYKGWFTTGDGQRCDPLTITDGFSRYLLRCQAVEDLTYVVARGVFEAAFHEYGLPMAMRTDNGTPFASTGLCGLSRLSVWWLRLGIQLERIQPGKPEQNGRHERMHLTLKQETTQPPAQNQRAQQRRFDVFREEYNQVRPHEALDMRTPASLYQPSSRLYPARIPEPEYDTGYEVRRVGDRGEFRWGGEKIFLTYALQDELIGLRCCDGRHWRIYFGTLPIAILDSFRLQLLNRRQAERFERLLASKEVQP